MGRPSLRRFHPSRTPGTRAGPSVPPEPFSSLLAVLWRIAHVSGRPARAGPYRPYRPFRGPGRTFSSVSAVFIPLAIPVPFSPACAVRWPWARVRGRRGTAGPWRASGGVFIRLGLPVPFRPVLCCFCHARCRPHPFCAVPARRGALFVRLGLPSSSAPVSAGPCPWAHVLPVFHCLGHLGLPCRFCPSWLFRALRWRSGAVPILLSGSLARSARFLCRPRALAICALRMPFPSSSAALQAVSGVSAVPCCLRARPWMPCRLPRLRPTGLGILGPGRLLTRLGILLGTWHPCGDLDR
jgi:hypothetical protein